VSECVTAIWHLEGSSVIASMSSHRLGEKGEAIGGEVGEAQTTDDKHICVDSLTECILYES